MAEAAVDGSTELAKLQRRLDRERRSRAEAERIAEDGLRALYEKQNQLQLLEEIAVAASQAHSVREAMQFAVDRVCAFTGWPLGHVYLVSDDRTSTRMLTTDVWYSPEDNRFSKFREATEKREFPAGEGLPGRVLESGQTAWINDVTKDTNFPRRESARQAGLRAAFAFPVLSGNDVVAVLEFFSEAASEPDDALLRLMSQIGTQLGRVVERVREQQLLHDAFHDHLTGLPNRALFVDRLQHAIALAKRHRDYKFAVLFIDIDRFKIVNDSLGHQAGDNLIMQIAQRLLRSLRREDTVVRQSMLTGPERGPGDDTLARLGGDEFTVLLDGIRDTSDGIRVAERIQQTLSAPFLISGQEVFVTASVGIASSSTGYTRGEDALRDADIAMYRAKTQGKARCAVFDQAMHEVAVNRLKLETDLRRGLEREEFQIYYQPSVSLKDGRIAGFEALLRWQRPEGGLASPSEFIHVAEEMGLIIPIGNWVLRQACEQTHRWHLHNPQERPLTISVNISARQFMQNDFVAQVDNVLRDTGIQPSALTLEMTESVTMGNAERTIRVVKELKELGVQLSIDDFGTGYSSLSYLCRFPIDLLKIDRSFVSDLERSSESREIVRTIITLARNLGIEVIAEGIETLEQLDHLKQLDCQLGQGFYFSEPVDSHTAMSLLFGTGPVPAALGRKS